MREEQQGQEARQRLHGSLLSGPHLPLNHPAVGSGKMRHNVGKLEPDQWKDSGKVGAGRMVGGEGHNFKGRNVDRALYHPDSFSNMWRPSPWLVQCSCSESSRHGYVGEGKSQLENVGSCGELEGLWTERSGVQASMCPRWPLPSLVSLRGNPVCFPPSPAPLFQLRVSPHTQ